MSLAATASMAVLSASATLRSFSTGIMVGADQGRFLRQFRP